MWSIGLCFFSFFGLTGGKALVFDIFRNSSAVMPEDICARLTCYFEENQDAFDIQQIISLTISEMENDHSAGKPLAIVSFFEAGFQVYGDPTEVSGTGHLLPKGGVLNVDLKGASEKCQTGIFSCKLLFINIQNKAQVIKVKKKLIVANETTKQSESNRLDSSLIKDLKTMLSDEVSKLGERSENVTNELVSAVKSVNQRLLRLEGMVDANLNTRLNSLDLKLNKLESILTELVIPKLTSLTEAVDNSTDSAKTYVANRFDQMQNQIVLLEASSRDLIIKTENWVNDSTRRVSGLYMSCENFQANFTSILQQVQNQFSTLKDEATRTIAAENRTPSSSSLLSTRIVMEALVKMAYNISASDIKLNQLKTDLNTDLQTVRFNISNLQENLTSKHERFSREVKENINKLDNKLTQKFAELANQKRSLSVLDKEVKGKLINIEVNLKDINFVLRTIKYIFNI